MRYHYHISDLIFYVRPSQLDIDSIKAVFNNLYTPTGFEIKHGDTVIDIGASLGDFSLFARQKGVRVVAFEPQPDNFALLIENVEFNELPITALQLAVSDKAESAKLYLNKGNMGMNSLIYKHSEDFVQTQTVALSDIFEIWNIESPVFLKFDCEGVEEYMFDTFKYWDRVDRIAGEARDQVTREKLQRLFEEHGFQVHKDEVNGIQMIYAKKY